MPAPTARYFDAFNIPIVAGRAFTDRDDRSSPPVVIVNAAMVRQFWPDEDPFNHQILIGQGAGPDFEETAPRQIVGVVGDVRHVGLEWNPRPTAYVPLAQMAELTGRSPSSQARNSPQRDYDGT